MLKIDLTTAGDFLTSGPENLDYRQNNQHLSLSQLYESCFFYFHNMIRYGMMWYDMIWYDMIWYDMIWYDMIWYDTWCMIGYDMIWYDFICT